MPNLLANGASGLELDGGFQRRCGLFGALLLSVTTACAPVPLRDGERRLALARTTEQVILPTHAELSQRTAELAELLEELAARPARVDLAEIRAAYVATRGPLAESRVLRFGPAEELRSAAALDQRPIDGAKIDAELAGDAELTVEYVAATGANKRGLHALEYLLFPAEDVELEGALLDDGEAGSRRRQFLASAARVVAQSAERLWTAWNPAEEDYATRFSRPGSDDSVARDVQSGLDVLLNQAIFASEVVASDKLGKPLGDATGGNIDPSAQESERSGTSLLDARGSLRGVGNVYFGARDRSAGPSLSSLVRAKSPVTDARARQALADAEAALVAIPEPLTQALIDAPELVTAASESVKTLRRILATEVLGTLGASLKFNDNDGD